MFTLVPFQQTAKANIAARFKQAKRVLLQSATGSGKTVIAVDFIKDWLEANPGKTVVCLFNLQVLLPQFEESFKRHGMGHEVSLLHDLITRGKDGSRMKDHKPGCERRILLTMPETLVGVMEGRGAEGLELCSEFADNVGLILIDEAHKGTSENFQKIRDSFDAYVLGLTATPLRVKNKDGESLREWYGDELVVAVSIRELIEMERLVQPLYYDLDEDAHLYYEWKRAVEKSNDDGNEQTLWFVRDTAHAKEWEAKLLEQGETVEIITSVDSEELGTSTQTPLQRQEIYGRFERGETKILISVRALCEGFDSPIAKYCVVDRGVGNRALWQQIIGRVIRPYEGKLNGHIIDRGGNRKAHGDVEDYTWSLEDEEDLVTVHVKGNVISEEKHTKADKVMVKCDTKGCPSVYNAKRHVYCPHCKTAHNLKVEVPAIVWLESKFPDMPSKAFPNLLTTFSKALSGDQRAMSLILNSIGFILDDTGDISEEYKALYEIAALKVRSEKDLKQAIRYAA